MSLTHALLGLIRYRPSTGYQLKNRFDQSIDFVWNATLPQIYRTLNHLEQQDWLRAETVFQASRPNRKVYHITDPGLMEFYRWLNEPMESVALKNPMLIKVFFGSAADPDGFAAHLREVHAYYTEQLGRFERQGVEIIQTEVAKFECYEEGEYWELSRDFGARWARMNLEWCENALKTHQRLKERREAKP